MPFHFLPPLVLSQMANAAARKAVSPNVNIPIVVCNIGKPKCGNKPKCNNGYAVLSVLSIFWCNKRGGIAQHHYTSRYFCAAALSSSEYPYMSSRDEMRCFVSFLSESNMPIYLFEVLKYRRHIGFLLLSSQNIAK